MLDLIIRGGTIVDGSGNPSFEGDVGVSGDRIIEVGRVSDTARRVIDAKGMLVTPGFVDVHTHYDGQATWDTELAPSIYHGVTSVVMGNCGVGFAPARPDKHDWLIALLEGVEDIPGTALAEGLPWTWESFPEYLDALAQHRFTVDVGTHMPHAALRTYVMGERGADHEQAPTDDEIAGMYRLTREAMDAGALGFTTSRTFFHRSRDGSNIGTLTATSRELIGVARALKDAGTGVIQLISDAYLSSDAAFAREELELIRQLAEQTGRPVSFTVQQTDMAPDRWREIFDWLDTHAGGPLSLRAQVAPRPIGLLFGLSATLNPFGLTATYRGFAHLPPAERAAALADPVVKARILAEHAGLQLEGMAVTATRGFDRMYRLTDPVDYEPDPSRSLMAEARSLGRDPADHAYDVFLEDEGSRLIYQPLINYALGNLDDVFGMITGRNVLFGLSDAGAHCGTICDASFPTTSLALWSRGNRSGHRVAVEALVHGYTKRNADYIGWHDRGVIAPGYLADLNIIALDDLELPPPVIAHDLPAGGGRLVQKARGYAATLKSGVIIVENGEPTGERPGRLLRGSRAAPRASRL